MAKEATHESGMGHHCDLSKLSQVGLKIVLLLIPLAFGAGGWVVASVYGLETVAKLSSTQIVKLEKKQDEHSKVFNHIDVVEERLTSMKNTLEEVRADLRELKSRGGD